MSGSSAYWSSTNTGLFDKVVVKLGPLTKAKVNHIVMDYTMNMKKLLEEMRILMNGFNMVLTQQPIPLEAIPDIFEFPKKPVAKILQGLSIPTKITGTNPGSSRLPIELSLDTRRRLGAMEEPATTLLKVIATPRRSQQRRC